MDIKKGVAGDGYPLRFLWKSNRDLGRLGGYFFLLLTWIKRLIMPTMRIPSWIISEYVTICRSPLSISQGATKRGEPPADARGAARLPFIGSTMFTIAQVFQNCKKNPPESGGFRGSLTNSAFSLTMDLLVWAGEVLRYTVGGLALPEGEVMLMWQNRMRRILWILICIAVSLYICTIKAR